MFTIEMDHDDIEIVVMDDDGNHADLQINSFVDIVYLRQWDDDLDRFITIAISPKMWEELISAMNLPEGAYITR